MTVKLKKRGVLASLACFLAITAVFAPLSFYAGKARGQVRMAFMDDLSRNKAMSRADYEALYRARRNGADCDARDADVKRLGGWEVFCDPHGSGAPTATAQLRDGNARPTARPKTLRRARPSAPRLKTGALDNAVLAALTQSAGGAEGLSGSPLSAALAPGGPLTQNAGLFAGGPGGPNSPGGLPGNVVPNFGAGVSGDGGASPPAQDIPGQDPPVLVTPIPAALPLLLTGLAGLFAASRRRRA